MTSGSEHFVEQRHYNNQAVRTFLVDCVRVYDLAEKK